MTALPRFWHGICCMSRSLLQIESDPGSTLWTESSKSTDLALTSGSLSPNPNGDTRKEGRMMKHLMKVSGVLAMVLGIGAVVHAGDFPVPELNPSILGSALTLLTGSMLVLFGKRSSK